MFVAWWGDDGDGRLCVRWKIVKFSKCPTVLRKGMELWILFTARMFWQFYQQDSAEAKQKISSTARNKKTLVPRVAQILQAQGSLQLII